MWRASLLLLALQSASAFTKDVVFMNAIGDEDVRLCIRHGTDPSSLSGPVDPLSPGQYTQIQFASETVYVGTYIVKEEHQTTCENAETIQLGNVTSFQLDGTSLNHIVMAATVDIAGAPSITLFDGVTFPNMQSSNVAQVFFHMAFGYECSVSLDRASSGTPGAEEIGSGLNVGDFTTPTVSADCSAAESDSFMYTIACQSTVGPTHSMNLSKEVKDFLGCEGSVHSFALFGDARENEDFPLRIIEIDSVTCGSDAATCGERVDPPLVTTSAPTPGQPSSPTSSPTTNPGTVGVEPPPASKDQGDSSDSSANTVIALSVTFAVLAVVLLALLVLWVRRCNQKKRALDSKDSSVNSRSSVDHKKPYFQAPSRSKSKSMEKPKSEHKKEEMTTI